MKNILSVCAFLLVFGALPLWGQSQDPLNEDQTTVRILEGDNSGPFLFYLYSGTGRLPVG